MLVQISLAELAKQTAHTVESFQRVARKPPNDQTADSQASYLNAEIENEATAPAASQIAQM